MRAVTLGCGIRNSRFRGAIWIYRDLPIGANPSGPTAALSAEPSNTMVIEKEIGFEFIEVGDFEAPAGNAAKQGAQDGFFQFRRRGKDNVPEIDLAILQGDAEYARVGAVLPVIADYSGHSLFVDSNTPDFDGLTDAELPVDHDCGAVVTDVNGLTFAQKNFTAVYRGGDANAQIHKNSFTAAEIFVQSCGQRIAFENRFTGFFAVIL